MTARLGLDVREDRVDWVLLHRVVRGPMRVASGSVAASVGVDAQGRLVAGVPSGTAGFGDVVDRLPTRIGDPAPAIVGGVPYGIERLLAVVLAAAAGAAQRDGDGPLHTVVVHPDWLDAHHVGLLQETLRRAAIGGPTSLATASEAAAAADRAPASGGERAALGGAQLAWERRPDDDHTAAAAGAAGGAAIVGGAVATGVDGTAVASTAAAGPTGVPLTPATAGPSGVPMAGPAAGPAGTPLPGPAAGPAGVPVPGPAAGPAGVPVTPGAPGPAGVPLPADPAVTTVPVSADHSTHHRKKGLRPRGRVLIAAGTAVVVIGAGAAIYAGSGDDAPTARVTEADEGTTATDATLGVTVTTTVTMTATPTTVAAPSGAGTATTVVAPTTTIASTAATAVPVAPGGTCPVGEWQLDGTAAALLIEQAFALEGEPGAVSFVGGSMDLHLGADGSWATTWNSWSWALDDADLGHVVITWDGSSAGSVTVNAGTVDIAETSGAVTTSISGPMTMSVPSDGLFTGTATYTCTGGNLLLQFPSNASPFTLVPAS